MYFRNFIQPDAMDCGSACLKMISSFYGKEYALETLRDYTFSGKAGVSLMGISKAAEKLGFRTVGGRITFEKLAEKSPFPCIVHWNQEHFVVVYEIKKHRNGKYTVFVADPGKGLLKYTKEEFTERWVSTKTNGAEKGVALILEPTTLFYEQTDEQQLNPKNKIRFLSKYFLRYRSFFGQLILGLLVGSLLLLAFPFLTQAVVDTGISNKNIGFIWLILLAQLMLLAGRTSIDFIRRRILLHISARINISLISDFFIKLMKLPMGFFDTKLLGDLLQRIEDHSRIERFLTAQSLSTLFSIFNFVVFGIVLLGYNLKIFLVFMAGSLLYGSSRHQWRPDLGDDAFDSIHYRTTQFSGRTNHGICLSMAGCRYQFG
jgi:ATP-binding cassette subfamily B protein